MASNFVSVGNVDNCKRWDKNKKEYVHIPRPEGINVYNDSMGGVDKLNFLISIYRTFIRSKKWTLRMFTHAIDIACANSWLEYKRDCEILSIPKKNIIDLVTLRMSIAESLIYADKYSNKRMQQLTKARHQLLSLTEISDSTSEGILNEIL